jgi:hypothetical protein
MRHQGGQAGYDTAQCRALDPMRLRYRQHPGQSNRACSSLAGHARIRPLRHRPVAKAESINESYLGRVLRLTLLSPRIIEAILEGQQAATLELDQLLEPIPVQWDQQRMQLVDDGT